MDESASAHIGPQICLFYRRWQGWRRILWWAWPIRWCLYEEQADCSSVQYYLSANEAAIALSRKVGEHERLKVQRERGVRFDR